MDIEPFLGDSKSLARWVNEAIDNPGQQYWLIFKDAKGDTEISLSTKMFPITGDTGNLSDDEFEEFDQSIHERGYSNFLNLDQVEDIIRNLSSQKSNYSDCDLINAINHYFAHDSFVTL